MKYVIALAVLGSFCFAQQSRKPACRPQNQGRFWPEEANSDRDARRRLYQRGELELCTLEVWKYRWERISVNARGLSMEKRDGGSTTGVDKADRAGATRR